MCNLTHNYHYNYHHSTLNKNITCFSQYAHFKLWPVRIWNNFILYCLADVYSSWWPVTSIFLRYCKPLAGYNSYTSTVQKIHNCKWQHAGKMQNKQASAVVAMPHIQSYMARGPFFSLILQPIQYASLWISLKQSEFQGNWVAEKES